MIVGIVGLPSSGKTTVFNAITGSDAPVGSFSSADTTHTATVWVRDERLEALRDHYRPRKLTPASFQVRDFCIISGEGEKIKDLNPRMLAAVREVDALLKVVRGFDLPGSPPDPAAELEEMDTEFLFADLGIIERRMERLEKSSRKPHPNAAAEKKELELLSRCREQLLAERPLAELEMKDEERKMLSAYSFLSLKPSLVVLNLDDEVSDEEARRRFAPLFAAHPDTVPLRARIQMELARLSEDERAAFMEELGIEDPAADKIVKAAFRLLGLISFFTIGKDEVRAWTLKKGSDALTAAGRIHTDLARGFIRAEVIHFDELASAGLDRKTARNKGLARLEAKNYVVRDGDVIEIRFNV